MQGYRHGTVAMQGGFGAACKQLGKRRSQAEAASVACGVYAGKEQRCNLWQELLVRQAPSCLWVLGLQQEVSKGARLKLRGLYVLQQVSDDDLQFPLCLTMPVLAILQACGS